nr:hypothetical protein [Vampirovibrio sp.]
MYSVSSTSPHGDGPENLEAVPPPDSQTLTVLEWPFIHDQLLDRCCTLYGQEAWQQQTFLDARTSVSQRLAEVAALEVLVTRYNPPEVDLLSVPDIRPGLARVAKGDVFGLDEIKSLLKTLDGGLEFIQHLVRGLAKEPQLTVLAPLLKQIPDMQPVSDYLAEKMDVDGELLDTASEALAKLSQRLRQETQHVRKHMQNLLNQPNISKALQDPVVTERSGRYVLPVKVAFKTLVPGIVHGDSASGSTLF